MNKRLARIHRLTLYTSSIDDRRLRGTHRALLPSLLFQSPDPSISIMWWKWSIGLCWLNAEYVANINTERESTKVDAQSINTAMRDMGFERVEGGDADAEQD